MLAVLLLLTGDPHWAFQPVRSPAPPEVKDAAWARTPIDRFILASLEREGRRLPRPADRATLIRRASFDLIGLPPTPAEVQSFREDLSPEAWERLIDRLLASPRYGERWGRHWLDLARYADSSGFHDDLDRPHAWRYRDYVIRAFNDDLPYGRFVREQLAGDEIDPRNPDGWIATGFCRNGPSNENNVKPAFREGYRLDQLDDVISTASTVFLGLTIGCARCHDHKTDPLKQEDYYRLLAVFNTAEKRDVTIEGILAGKPVAPKKKSKDPVIMALTDGGAKPRVTRLLIRGNWKTPAGEVQPGVPGIFTTLPVSFTAPVDGARTTGRRRALADWIVSPDNPLTWRVLANRIWQHHFGEGLVATPNNFGVSGERPTHPDLLDWLTGRLIEEGGRLKPIHRLIMTSSFYRAFRKPRRLEAEAVRDAILTVSGTINLHAGGPGAKPRIPAEIIERSQRNKWPNVRREGPVHWRRSVYIYVKRQLLFPLMELFDAPTAASSCGRRTVSTTPTQALALLNDPFTTDQAAYFADRVARTSTDPREQVEHAFRLAFGYVPGPEWVEEGVEFVKRRGLPDLGVVIFNTSRFVYVD